MLNKGYPQNQRVHRGVKPNDNEKDAIRRLQTNEAFKVFMSYIDRQKSERMEDLMKSNDGNKMLVLQGRSLSYDDIITQVNNQFNQG